MLIPSRDLFTSCTLLLFMLFHLHGSRVKTKDAPLFFIESFDILVLEARLHEDLQILRLRMELEIEPSPSCP